MKHATSWLALLLVFCLTLPSGLTAAAAKQGETAQEQTFTITVGQSFQDADGNALGTAFLDSNSRMLVPLRALAEQMELTVTWDAARRTAAFTGTPVDSTQQTEVCFTAGSNRYTITADGHTQTMTMDSAVVVSDNRTYAPVRYLATAFGYQVGWDGATRTATITTEALPEQQAPVGTISFETLDAQVRSGSATYLALEENISAISAMDYDTMSSELRDQLNQLADGIWFSSIYTDDSYTQNSLQSAYDSLRDTFDDIKSGELQKDNADTIRQLRDAQDQILMGAQTLYAAVLSLEQSRQDLVRSLGTLDRSIEEMELRYQLGQISALTLEQVKSNRATLTSNLDTLDMNLANYKAQLQTFLGQTPTGELTLQPLPHLTQSQLSSMNLEQDLAAAKEKSWTLYSAQLTLEDAEETWKDAQKDYNYGNTKDERYLYEMAQHTWQAAQYTYDAAVENYELSFRQLYASVGNYQQLLGAAESTLAYEQQNYEAMQLKYELGTISLNTLLDAEDTYNAAISAVNTAKSDLFTAYNNYCWAVNQGLLS